MLGFSHQSGRPPVCFNVVDTWLMSYRRIKAIIFDWAEQQRSVISLLVRLRLGYFISSQATTFHAQTLWVSYIVQGFIPSYWYHKHRRQDLNQRFILRINLDVLLYPDEEAVWEERGVSSDVQTWVMNPGMKLMELMELMELTESLELLLRSCQFSREEWRWDLFLKDLFSLDCEGWRLQQIKMYLQYGTTWFIVFLHNIIEKNRMLRRYNNSIRRWETHRLWILL